MNAEMADSIAQRLLSAAEIFAQRNPIPDAMRESWSVWWRVVPDADDLFRKAVEDLVRSNPSQLSHSDTASALTYRTNPSLALFALGEASVDRAALRVVLQETVLRLANTRRSRRLQFIIENLVVDGEVPQFYGVELVLQR